MRLILVARKSPFLDLVAVKSHLIVEHTNDDALIQHYMEAAIAYCENYTRRTIQLSSMKAVSDTFPSVFEFNKPPIRSVESISYMNTEGDMVALDGSLFDVDQYSDRGRIVAISSWPGIKAGMNRVVIEYTAGYGAITTNAGGGFPYTFPIVFTADTTNYGEDEKALRIAMYLLIGHWYENREAVSIGSAVSIGRAVSIPFGIESILSQYVVIKA